MLISIFYLEKPKKGGGRGKIRYSVSIKTIRIILRFTQKTPNWRKLALETQMCFQKVMLDKVGSQPFSEPSRT